MEIIKVNINSSAEWKDFLSSNYNMFFDGKFLEYNDEFDKGIKWHHLIFKDKFKTLAILNGNERIEKEDKVYISCDGVSFGGFMWTDKIKINDMNNVIKLFKNYLIDNNFTKCIIRNPPFLYRSHANEEYEYVLLSEGFSVNKYAITNIIDLSSFEFEKLKNSKKRSIQKSSEIIEIELIEDIVTGENLRDFYNILHSNRELKNVVPTHSLEELVFLKNNLPDKIKLFTAKIENEIVGICTLFIVKKDVVLNFYLAADEEHKRNRVSDYLLYYSIEWSKEKNFRIYDIGTSSVDDRLLQGLFDFKKKFRADGFLRKSYIIKL